MSYDFYDYNSDVVITTLIKHVEKNLSKYQTVSYEVKDDPGTIIERIPDIIYSLTSGTYFFWYKNSLMWINLKHITKDEAPMTYVVLKSFRWNQALITDFIQFIRTNSLKTCNPRIFCNKRHHDVWLSDGFMPPRALNSVIIPENTMNFITDDLDNFLKPETLRFYKQRGVIYKRGLLLYGKPGCGKSSLIRGLAQKYKYDLYDMNLNVDDSTFTGLMGRLPGKVILLFEDVDVAFPKREQGTGAVPEKPNNGRLTMKCFLNAIDGIRSRSNGSIMIFTTNHPDKLDPALLRAGRIDLKIELGPLTRDDIKRMFRVFYPVSTLNKRSDEEAEETNIEATKDSDKEEVEEADKEAGVEDESEKVATLLEKEEVIPAEFHGFLVKNMYNSPEEVINKLENDTWSNLIA